jgi:Zn-finger nucleic acid-binding protein
MKCPVCNNVDLKIAERQEVEIDYCPQCRGVWLDRDELDKIIERSYSSPNEKNYPEECSHSGEERLSPGYKENDHHYDDHHDSHDYERDKHHKRKSLLRELFDF